MNKADKDKVIALADQIACLGNGERPGNSHGNELGKQIADIMRGLAEDTELLALFAASQKQLPLNAAISATSPQAAQTALKSESSAQAAQAPARPPSEGKPIEALALTEAQEREAFEEFMLTKYPAHLCHWVGDQYSEMFARLVFVGWKAGRAGSKP